jgi:hypothetical protein
MLDVKHVKLIQLIIYIGKYDIVFQNYNIYILYIYSNVDTILNCRHCLCSDCSKKIIKPITNIIYTLETTL